MPLRNFIKNYTIAAVLAFISLACVASGGDYVPENNSPNVTTTSEVIVIGAGIAGLTAGYELQLKNIDFIILEATDRFGGRLKKDTEFTDVPIDLGAEWIHTASNPKELLASFISDKAAKDIDVELIKYLPTNEFKFKNTTWYDFVADNLAQAIAKNIIYNSPVTHINYSSDTVVVKAAERNYTAKKVLVTVPLGVLKAGIISFEPELSREKQDAIASIVFPQGLKAFLKFSSNFYPELYEDDIDNVNNGEVIEWTEYSYFDATLGKGSDENILGVLVVRTNDPLAQQQSDEVIVAQILEDLDQKFNGRATATFKAAIVENWTTNPYVRGTYSSPSFDKANYSSASEEEWEATNVALRESLAAPVNSKVYFAGEATSLTLGSSANEAALSAISALTSMGF
ncbi:flavin monoamine oxidase family protein [Planctobacterium marinum]|uniref:Tryptophan 2-monooxygenase n=1 Tax=Planctobacterium marinum TaxID=1631968 RepID=A0AA48KTL2_9ALTE|nr:hypothetical protein MACH26_38180 [Planctobacterium marinum]